MMGRKGVFGINQKFSAQKVLDGPIIILIPNNEVPGCWIEQKCSNTGCKKNLVYWSKSGHPKREYQSIKCEEHR